MKRRTILAKWDIPAKNTNLVHAFTKAERYVCLNGMKSPLTPSHWCYWDLSDGRALTSNSTQRQFKKGKAIEGHKLY